MLDYQKISQGLLLNENMKEEDIFVLLKNLRTILKRLGGTRQRNLDIEMGLSVIRKLNKHIKILKDENSEETEDEPNDMDNNSKEWHVERSGMQSEAPSQQKKSWHWEK